MAFPTTWTLYVRYLSSVIIVGVLLILIGHVMQPSAGYDVSRIYNQNHNEHHVPNITSSKWFPAYTIHQTVHDTTLGVLALPGAIRLRQPLKVGAIKIKEEDNGAVSEEIYESILKEQPIECRERIRFGHVQEGGWDVCIAGPYRPSEQCLVYSFGIKFDWSFDEHIANEFNCDVRSYDPSMGLAQHEHSKNVMFYPIGIAGKNTRVLEKKKQEWEVRTLGSLIVQNNHHNRIIDYLKMDIEYYEWEVLEVLFKENILPRVKQLGFEVHTNVVRKASKFPTSTEEYLDHVKVLRELERHGFRKWYSHTNPGGLYYSERTKTYSSSCHELVYINMNFLKTGYMKNGIPPLQAIA